MRIHPYGEGALFVDLELDDAPDRGPRTQAVGRALRRRIASADIVLGAGTLGVREVAYVLFYGAFGVAAEPALLVSFCALVGLLGNYAVGTLLHLGAGRPPLAGMHPTRV